MKSPRNCASAECQSHARSASAAKRGGRLAGKLGQQQLETRRDTVLPGRDNISLTVQNGDGPHLLLNGHTDTVSVAGMSIDPFSGDVRDGRPWGRGASDMKGPPPACRCLAGPHARRLARPRHGRLCGGRGNRIRGIPERSRISAGITPWLANPPAMRCAVARLRTPARARVRSSRPQQRSQPGRNAIVGMAPVLEAMQAFFDEEFDDTPARASRRPPVPWA